MNLSYVLLTALLIAATAAIYGTYLYMLDKSKDFHTEDVALTIEALLNLEPGQAKTAHVAIPHGTQVKICPDKECRCGAPTCILVTGPTQSAKTGTTAEVRILPTNQETLTLPAGTYIIKAHAEPPSLERLTACRIFYQAITDINTLATNTCEEIIKNIESATGLPIQDVLSILGVDSPCQDVEKTIHSLYRYLCVKKIVYLEVTPT